MRIPSVIAAAIVSGTAVVAAAQPPQSTAEPGSRVYVTLEAGEDTLAGSLLELSAESVTILLDGQTRTFPIGEVARIQRHGDPSGDGAGKGATTIGPWCLLVCGQGTGNGREFGTAVVGNAAIGVLVGWAIDRGHVGRTTIYPAKAESRGSGSAFAVAAAQTGRQPSITPRPRVPPHRRRRRSSPSIRSACSSSSSTPSTRCAARED